MLFRIRCSSQKECALVWACMNGEKKNSEKKKHSYMQALYNLGCKLILTNKEA